MRFLDRLPKTCSIFDVTVKATYTGIEYVLQGILPEEQIAYYSQAVPVLTRPELTKLSYRVDLALYLSKFHQQLFVIATLTFQKGSQF